METIQITKEKVDELIHELSHLTEVVRPEIAARLTAARAQGDLSENAEYLAAKKEQEITDFRIDEIETFLKKIRKEISLDKENK